MQKLKRKIKNEINENKEYLYLGYLISILTMIPQFVASLHLTVHLIFLSLVLIIVLSMLKFSKLLFSIFIIYINLTNIIIGHIFIHWGYSGHILNRIEVAFESPDYQSLEYLNTYIDYKDVLLVLYSIFILVLLYKFLVHFKHSFKVIKFLGFILFIAILLPVNFTRNPIERIEPFSIPHEVNKAKEFFLYPRLRTEYLNTLPSKPIVDKQKIYDAVIVIQGEAANKHHMSIYGYDKNTTPFFSSLQKNDNFYIFNAISPVNETRFSVPILHTKATVYNFFDAYMHSRSIIGDFRIHGYETHWISSQASSGLYDSTISSLSREANTIFFANIDTDSWDIETNINTDKALVDYLNSFKDKNISTSQMYFIHLIGSHFIYENRYTQDAILFQNNPNIQEKYDNTIYYTDYILKNLFNYFKKSFKDKNILFIYTSDHGQVVSEEKHGHGFIPAFKDEYDVPFIIYSNIKNNRIDELYKNNQKKYFNLENLNYMIEYISGINDDLNISYSSKVFGLEPGNIFDYDKLDFYIDTKQ
jgi:heptose-I-phosphate ethanolaminephosphotransferase